MEGEKISSSPPESQLSWEVYDRSNKYAVRIYLRDKVTRETVGEFTFHIREEKKLDPLEYGHRRSEPYPYPDTDWLAHLRSAKQAWAEQELEALETKPSTIAYVGMWQVKDRARGNLAVARRLFEVALQEFKKYGVEYVVGKYVSQGGDGQSVAPYAEDMYRRMAKESGGEVHRDGNVWVSVDGLTRWLKNRVAARS